MSIYVPPGEMPLSTALARAAKVLCPEAWEQARPEIREFMAEGCASDRPPWGLWTSPGSVGVLAYEALRPMLADGRLPATLRKATGASELIDPPSWRARDADRPEAVLSGTVTFAMTGGQEARGDVLIRIVDLEDVLAGKAVARPIPAPSPALGAAPREKAGRRPNPDADRFWIEVCRLVDSGSIKGGQAGFTEHMAQWSENNMTAPYDAETVRKKVGTLFKSLGWKR